MREEELARSRTGETAERLSQEVRDLTIQSEQDGRRRAMLDERLKTLNGVRDAVDRYTSLNEVEIPLVEKAIAQWKARILDEEVRRPPPQ